MTGVGRAGKSHVGAAEADHTWGSSSSSPQTGRAPGEGRQAFEPMLEPMRTAPQDRTAQLLDLPPAFGAAVPMSLSGEEIAAAKQKMRSLVEDFDASKDPATQARDPSEAQVLIDQVIKAGSEALDYYANLPPDVARRLLSNNQARRLRHETLAAGNECNSVATRIVYDLEANRRKATAVLDQMRASNAPSGQLSRAASSVAKHYLACIEWWGKKVSRSERMQSVCTATANLPGTTPEMRKAEEVALRLQTGWVLNTQCMYLQSRIALAQLMIESQASRLEPAVNDTLIGENGEVCLLGTFIKDVFPAFVSTAQAALYSNGAPLDAEHCTVLEGVMERLSEFASGMHGIVAKLRDARTGADLPLELLDQIVEGAWVTADDVTRLLGAQPNRPVLIEPLASATPENTRLGAEGQLTRRKGKGKRAPAASEGSSMAGLGEPQLARPDAAAAPTAKVVVLSDHGTKKLASAEEVRARASSSATGHLEMWQAPPSRKALTGLLKRLDELLQFDLPAQQSAVSRARQMKPEDADHVVNLAVKRLQTQAAEIEVCVAALGEPRRRGLLTPAQVPEVHEKMVRLKAILSEVQGQANALNARKATITMDCMKIYAFPSQKYLEQLRAAEELASVDAPRALKGEPGTLFEIKLQPKALRSGAMPSPMWVHIHTKWPADAWQLRALSDADFAACHVKSDVQRGYNRHWQSARAATGHENVVIHRGKLTPAFCKSLLSIAHRYRPFPRRSPPDQTML
ncbi:hypothetical protein ACKWRH_45840 (plasmid) [Bradyrhizobium sp. Pa8]|uniref:hypothetical protein n=1 Tax=Bradyrhizobium sp. Pa8 TaxID=3386552 RepID=UPI00403FAE55